MHGKGGFNGFGGDGTGFDFNFQGADDLFKTFFSGDDNIFGDLKNLFNGGGLFDDDADDQDLFAEVFEFYVENNPGNAKYVLCTYGERRCSVIRVYDACDAVTR